MTDPLNSSLRLACIGTNAMNAEPAICARPDPGVALAAKGGSDGRTTAI